MRIGRRAGSRNPTSGAAAVIARLEKARQYRDRAADESIDEIDRARLPAAARAIEINGHEWTQVARQLAR